MIVWTLKSRRAFRRHVARELAAAFAVTADARQNSGQSAGATDPAQTQMNSVDWVLEKTFPSVDCIIVQDVLSGFRPPSKDEAKYILLVEVGGVDGNCAYVVKISEMSKMQAELDGWMLCKPPSLKQDLVLLSLERGYFGPTWPVLPSMDAASVTPRLCSLKYGAAQQFIGVERMTSFEEAFLQSVRFGVPLVTSLDGALNDLFERLGHLLYSTSFVDDPAEEGYVFRLPRIYPALAMWERDASHKRIRSGIDNLQIPLAPGSFLDPIDYLRKHVLPHLKRLRALPDSVNVSAALPPEDVPASVIKSPSVADLIPRMLRGCAHGDLHGRNILVGRVRDRAVWPTVFDYEDMGPDNFVGWDFVKLETELKIRAQSDIFDRQEEKYIKDLHEFELDLARRTEDHYQDGTWPHVAEIDGTPPKERLMSLLLTIRRLAGIHLGIDRQRPRDWLEEYYFLLMCYGVNTGKFGNLDPRQITAAYVSAGVATARMNWPRNRFGDEGRELGVEF